MSETDEAPFTERELSELKAFRAFQKVIAPEAPVAPEIPASHVPAPVAVAQQGPQPPAGKAPLTSLDEAEGLPQAERIARMDEIDALWLAEGGA